MDLLCRGEAYHGSVLPREPPGFFREKPSSEFSFLLEALEEGKEQEKLGVRTGNGKCWTKQQCFGGVLVPSRCACFPVISVMLEQAEQAEPTACQQDEGSVNPPLEVRRGRDCSCLVTVVDTCNSLVILVAQGHRTKKCSA